MGEIINIQLIGAGGGYVGEASILRSDPLPVIAIWDGQYFVLVDEQPPHLPIYRRASYTFAHYPNALRVLPDHY